MSSNSQCSAHLVPYGCRPIVSREPDDFAVTTELHRVFYRWTAYSYYCVFDMSLPHTAELSAGIEKPLSNIGDAEMALFIKPIMAGARARGVADGLEMIGLGAVLIDATGRVLHASGRAHRLLGGHARIVGDHLIAERPVDNEAFQVLIGSAIGAGRHDPERHMTIESRAGDRAVSLRAIRFSSEEGEVQRLHAVLVVEEERSPTRAETGADMAVSAQ